MQFNITLAITVQIHVICTILGVRSGHITRKKKWKYKLYRG